MTTEVQALTAALNRLSDKVDQLSAKTDHLNNKLEKLKEYVQSMNGNIDERLDSIVGYSDGNEPGRQSLTGLHMRVVIAEENMHQLKRIAYTGWAAAIALAAALVKVLI